MRDDHTLLYWNSSAFTLYLLLQQKLPYLFASFLRTAGIEMMQVPYRDFMLSAQDLAEGRLDVYAAVLTTVLPLAEAGKSKLLAVTGRQRASIAPDVPTAVEQGFTDDAFNGLTGFFGPRDMPADRRDRIAADIRAAAADTALVDRLAALGQSVRSSTPAECAAAIGERYAKIGATVTLIGGHLAH